MDGRNGLLRTTGLVMLLTNGIFLVYFLLSGFFLFFTQMVERNAAACVSVDFFIAVCIAAAIRAAFFMSKAEQGNVFLYSLAHCFISWFLIMLQYYVMSLAGGIPELKYLAEAMANTAVYALLLWFLISAALISGVFTVSWVITSGVRRAVAVFVLVIVLIGAVYAASNIRKKIGHIRPLELNVFTPENRDLIESNQ